MKWRFKAFCYARFVAAGRFYCFKRVLQGLARTAGVAGFSQAWRKAVRGFCSCVLLAGRSEAGGSRFAGGLAAARMIKYGGKYYYNPALPEVQNIY
jgi:ABC-type sulfate transport system permease component